MGLKNERLLFCQYFFEYVSLKTFGISNHSNNIYFVLCIALFYNFFEFASFQQFTFKFCTWYSIVQKI